LRTVGGGILDLSKAYRDRVGQVARHLRLPIANGYGHCSKGAGRIPACIGWPKINCRQPRRSSPRSAWACPSTQPSVGRWRA